MNGQWKRWEMNVEWHEEVSLKEKVRKIKPK